MPVPASCQTGRAVPYLSRFIAAFLSHTANARFASPISLLLVQVPLQKLGCGRCPGCYHSLRPAAGQICQLCNIQSLFLYAFASTHKTLAWCTPRSVHRSSAICSLLLPPESTWAWCGEFRCSCGAGLLAPWQPERSVLHSLPLQSPTGRERYSSKGPR